MTLYAKISIAPLDAAILAACDGRHCPVLDDRSWRIAGILRAIEPVVSGRDFLQRFHFLFPGFPSDAEISPGHYFESLKSQRRLGHFAHTAQLLAAAMADAARDPLRPLHLPPPALPPTPANPEEGRGWAEKEMPVAGSNPGWQPHVIFEFQYLIDTFPPEHKD